MRKFFAAFSARPMSRRSLVPTQFQRAALVASAAVVTLGLSACERDARPAPESAQRDAQVSIFNATHDVLPLLSQPLNRSYSVDCDLVLADPTSFIFDEHLSSAKQLFLYSGVEEPLEGVDDRPGVGSTPDADCHINVLSTTDGRLSEIAVSWPRDLEEKTFYTDVDAPANVPPEPQTVVVEADYDDVSEERIRPWRDRPCGGSVEDCSQEEFEELIVPVADAHYRWAVVGEAPELHDWSFGSVEEVALEDEGPQCATGREATPLSWEQPPSGTWLVDAVVESHQDAAQSPASEQAEGSPSNDDDTQEKCFSVSLLSDDAEEEWEFCGSRRLANRLASEEKAGTVHVRFYTEHRYGSPPSAYEALTIDIERKTDEGERFESELIEAIRGRGIPEHMGLDWDTYALTDCEGRREVESCDQLVLPLLIHVNSPGGMLEIPAGRTDYLEPQSHRRIEVVRAMHRVVADRDCRNPEIGPYQFAKAGPYLELIYYAGVSPVGEE